MPPNSAAAEQNFSAFCMIHTKKWNRLKLEKSMKPVYVYHNLRLHHGICQSEIEEPTVLAEETDDYKLESEPEKPCLNATMA